MNRPRSSVKQKCTTPTLTLRAMFASTSLGRTGSLLTINSIVYGLQYLFLEPNPEDPLNKEAALELQSNRRLFEQNVQKTMKGGNLNGIYFERCLKQ